MQILHTGYAIKSIENFLKKISTQGKTSCLQIYLPVILGRALLGLFFNLYHKMSFRSFVILLNTIIINKFEN
jgi:hypothetical protein